MLHRSSWIPIVAVAMFAGNGCVGRGISEGVGLFTGPKGIAAVIQPVSSQTRDVALEDYTRFEMATFTDDFGRTPPEVFSMLPEEFDRELADHKIYNQQGGKTLLVRGKVIHFEDSRNVTSQAFGPFEELVARVELVDKSTGRVLGVANCIGRSTQTVNQGVPKKVQGLAGAIAGWIADHHGSQK